MLETAPCPVAYDYVRLAGGLTPAPEAERLLTHLETCQGCGRMVESLPEADGLADLVRQAATIEGSTPLPAVVQLIDQLSRLRPDAPAVLGLEQAQQKLTQASPDANERHPTELYAWLAAPQADGELGCLGPYRVLRVIGVGGMGVVFRAQDPHLDRIVALKAMLPGLASREGARQRFLREARATASVKHDHIVAIYQASEDRGVPFLAMEFLEGETLELRLRRQGKLPVAEVLRIGREMAMGLAAAHHRALIHRDIKPANVWLEAETHRVKILDFGLVRAVGAARELTHEGTIIGTPAYMSPEQAQGIEVDHRCDLFSLGCVLYRMATGEPPFSGADTISTLLAISTHTPPPPSQIDAALPPALSDLIMDLLAKNPADRPASARAVAEALERAARPVPGGPVDEEPTTWKKRPVLAGVVACVLLLGLSILWAGGVLRLNTKDGTIVLEDLPLNAEVIVVGATAKVKNGPDGKWIEVQVAPGERMLLIQAPGFKAKTQDVILSTGERKPIRIHLEPLPSQSLEARVSSTAKDGPVGRPNPAPPSAVAPFDAETAKNHQEAWAKYLDVPVEFTNSVGMKFRLIPPGEFTMGSTAAEIDAAKPMLFTGAEAERPQRVHSEGPQRRVMLTKPFYLAIHELTQRLYKQLTGSNPSEFCETGVQRAHIAGRDVSNYPVENITWPEAVRCCNLLSKAERLPAAYRITAISILPSDEAGYRLPSEAEWEFACRAGTTTLFWCGDDEESLARSAWYGINNQGNSPKPVGTKPANPFGLHDIHGNVWEWLDDGWDPQFYQKLIGPAAMDPHSTTTVENRRVIRGGDYFMSPAESRSACRDGCVAGTRWNDLGLRPALSVDAVRKTKGKDH